MRDEVQAKRGRTGAKPRPADKKTEKRPTSVAPPGIKPRPSRLAVREPIYLASQLASICDVDLKTIHNWCERNGDPRAPAELDCFRTPGGHLRFRHSAVLRFLSRWGYPLPDALLRDRPHVLLVEADLKQREKLLTALSLVRPGEDDDHDGDGHAAAATPSQPAHASGDGRAAPEPPDSTLGLFANPRYYVHVWDDPYAALVAVGERTGANSPPDIVVLSLPLPSLDEKAWLRTLRERAATQKVRFVLLVSDDRRHNAAVDDPAVLAVVPRARPEQLRAVLDEHAVRLAGAAEVKPLNGAKPTSPGQRKRRVPIAPREPIFVASQVANIWDVDLKTVHNWVERGDIEAFRTPGRHLRFRRRSLLHFLRRYNMAIPEELVPQKPRVMLVDPDGKTTKRLSAPLAQLFEVVAHTDPVAALAEIGAQCSGASLIDAVVVTFPVDNVDDRRWVSALARHPDTRYTRVVVVCGEEARRKDWQELGVIATVQRTALEQVVPVLEKALGLNH